MSSQPDFSDLSEAEQRAVAERLRKIAESKWRPFWCPDSGCNGDPHWAKVVDDGVESYTFVGESDVSGPQGEPVGPVVYEDDAGDWYTLDRKDKPNPAHTVVGRPLLDPMWAHNHARQDQRLPNWLQPWTLFIMSGRGSGKTRTGVEFVTLCARKGLDGAILGRRGTELVNTHVAEIIKHAHPEFVPIHWASKDILEWPNGAITYLFSAEKPENIRSVNLSYAWVDEAAFMDEIETAWMNLTLATRISKPGNPIHFLITSTPTGTPWVMEMEDDPEVEVRRVSTYANKANLDENFLNQLEKKYEGTRMGRQELHGEVLRDVEGALWNDDMFKHLRCERPEDFTALLDSMDDIVLAIDPAGSKGKRSDATGIIAVGVQHRDDSDVPLPWSRFFVLGRGTIKGSPSEWAEQAYKMARYLHANRIVAEKNYGGEMVKQVLTDWAKLNPAESKSFDGDDFRIEVVHAVQSKETRAEATVGKYEQGRVTHVTSPGIFGDLSELEKQQVIWVPKSRGGNMPSPNDIDALVWAVRACENAVKFDGKVATQANVWSKIKKSVQAAVPAPEQPKSVTITPVTPAGGRKARSFPVATKKPRPAVAPKPVQAPKKPRRI